MAEPLKNQFGGEIPEHIAQIISQAFPPFEHEAFVKEALDGYEANEV